MKLIVFSLTLFSLILTFSSKAFSQSRFCANPLKAICGGQEALVATNAKSSVVESIKKDIIVEATRKTIQIKKELIKVNPNVLESRDFNLKIDKIFNEQIMNAAKSRMSQIETVVTNSPIISYLKIFFKIAIDQSSLDQASKHNFKRIIDSIIIGNFNDYITRAKISKYSFEKTVTACGIDGMNHGAVAITNNGQRYVLICPGMQITMYKTPNMQQRINNILMVLAHEMGHHILYDSPEVAKEIYSPYLTCVFNNYAQNLNKSERNTNFCLANPGSRCDVQKVVSHSGEMIADLWANKVLAIYAQANNYSARQMDDFLLDTYGNTCGKRDEGIHPSGHFRIGTMLRLAPEINAYLGCDNSYTGRNRTCTLEGEVSL